MQNGESGYFCFSGFSTVFFLVEFKGESCFGLGFRLLSY